MKLEETISLSGLCAPRRLIDNYYHELCHIPAQELFDALIEHNVPLNKNACRLNYSGNICIPLGTQLPEKFFCEAKSYEFFGSGERQEYTFKLTFNADRFGYIQAEYLYDGWAKRKTESTIRNNIEAALDTLKKQYELERAEDERKRKEESDRIGYVHPDSFGGSDF